MGEEVVVCGGGAFYREQARSYIKPRGHAL